MNIRIKGAVKNHKKVSHGGLYSKSNDRSIVDFSSNVSPLGPPHQAKAAVTKNINDVSFYPDQHAELLKERISYYTKAPRHSIVVGNGATELIYNFCQSFVLRGSRVLIQSPTFGEYEAASKLNEGRVGFFETLDIYSELDGFLGAIPKKGVVFVCNPNNPTGKLIPRSGMKQIVDTAKKRSSAVLVDECFMELVPDRDESVMSLVKKYDNLFVLRSLTKSFCLAGLRIGYGIASRKIASAMDTLCMPWNVNSLAQHAAIAVLERKRINGCFVAEEYLKRAKNLIKKEYSYLKESISNIRGFDCLDSATNFILIRTPQDSRRIQEKLLKKKILVRDCSSFRGLGNNYIRVVVRSHRDNMRLVRELKRL